MTDETDSAEVSRDRPPGIGAQTMGWLDALGDRFRTGAALALAETRLALSTFMLMLFLTVLAAGALLFAWGFLVYAIAQSMGFSASVTALGLVAVHVLLAWLLWFAVGRLGRNMEFNETRRLFGSGADDSETAAENDDEH